MMDVRACGGNIILSPISNDDLPNTAIDNARNVPTYAIFPLPHPLGYNGRRRGLLIDEFDDILTTGAVGKTVRKTVCYKNIDAVSVVCELIIYI